MQNTTIIKLNQSSRPSLHFINLLLEGRYNFHDTCLWMSTAINGVYECQFYSTESMNVNINQRRLSTTCLSNTILQRRLRMPISIMAFMNVNTNQGVYECYYQSLRLRMLLPFTAFMNVNANIGVYEYQYQSRRLWMLLPITAFMNVNANIGVYEYQYQSTGGLSLPLLNTRELINMRQQMTK